MKKTENIYLIGLMGAGKTTIGRQLATALKVPFYDSDKAIEESTGVDIPTIFEYEGEKGFRQREQTMLGRLIEIDGIVLATGGGAILREKNRKLLKKNGFVVYLECSVEHILKRTRRDSKRPLLQTDNPKESIESLFEQREALYLECADFKIDTGTLQTKLVVNAILEAYEQINDE
ncbi:MAG: shikimate kinase AroK [Methylococcales bacterium]|nr:shikimate kinase AroK [Methylococcales bacterium]